MPATSQGPEASPTPPTRAYRRAGGLRDRRRRSGSAMVAAWFLMPGMKDVDGRSLAADQARCRRRWTPIGPYGYLKKICARSARTRRRLGRERQGQRSDGRRALEEDGRRAVREQPFNGDRPRDSNAPVAMVNLIGSWFPERVERVLLGVHYDTRPFPDEDPDPAQPPEATVHRGQRPGASGDGPPDGDRPPPGRPRSTPWGVDLVLFDGEELVYGGGQDQRGDYFHGSKAFAKEYYERKKGGPRYAAGLVFDMVGGRDLVIEKEQYSMEFAPSLVRDVWSVAKSLKVTQFRDRVGVAVYDDHLPLNNGGIPAIDLIHFPYKHWHTANDLPENCSATSLEQVGKVVTAWLNKSRARGR